MRSVRGLTLAGLVMFGALSFGAAPALATGYGFTSSFGSEGSGEGQFKEPTGITVSEVGATKGDVYVVDKGNNRVEYFSATGSYIGEFNGTEIDGAPAGAGREAPAKLSEPDGIAIENAAGPSEGDVYVIDVGNRVIDKFSATGAYEGQLTGTCPATGETVVGGTCEPSKAASTSFSTLCTPFIFAVSPMVGVAVDSEGNVWISCGAHSQIYEFTKAGSFVKGFYADGWEPGRALLVDSKGTIFMGEQGGPLHVFVQKGEHLLYGESFGLNTPFGGGSSGVAIDPATNDLFFGEGNGVSEYGPFGEPFGTPIDGFGIAHLVGGSGVAVSSTGAVYSADSSKDDVDIFMEGAKEGPAVEGESVSGLTSTGATLHATVNPDYESTSYFFEYSASKTTVEKGEGARVPGTPLSPLPAEFAALHVSAVVGGLQPGETYYYRVVVENETTKSEPKPLEAKIESFTPYAVPAATTGEAQDLTGTSAVLTGTVNAQGTATTYYFAYIDQAGYERALAGDPEEKANPYASGETTLTKSAGSSFAPQTIEPTLAAGLRPGETYDYALIATNQFDQKDTGPDAVLTTLAGRPPVVSTGPASAISQNSATLSGTVATSGLQSEYGFEIATEPGEYGPATGLGSIGGSLANTVTLTLSELQPGTTYYYRVTASSADGTSYGEPQTFSTPGFPSLLTASTSLPLIAVPDFVFPTGSLANTGTPTETKTKTKTLTNAQKLGKALKACHKDRSKAKRTNCERTARRRYAPAGKSKGAARKKK
jgi:hypothetical protein